MSDYRSSHPVGMQGVNLWFGVEVEGRLQGLRTAFIADVLTAEEQGRLFAENCKQWFFTETFTQWHWYAQSIIARHPPVVTVAVLAANASQMFAIREQNPSLGHLEIIVRVFDAPWWKSLKEYDQVSVGVPYNMITFPVENGFITEPHEYRGDRKP